MTQWAIVAELPLGVYRGRLADGSTDPIPAPARLHGALLNAAAQGTRAELVDGGLRPRSEDVDALRWLETNPPTGVHIPPTRRSNGPDGRPLTVYRDEGTLKKEGGMSGPGRKKAAKPFADVIAVNGSFAWTWETPPPAAVARSFEGLVADVSHLGTSESPARMHVGTAEPTHHLDSGASVFQGRGADLDIAVEGRTAALMEAYAAEQRTPRPPEDRYTISEEPRSRAGWPTARRTARYTRPEAPAAPVPWEGVLLARLSGDPVGPAERVAFAVSVHRALVRSIGDGAPPVVTGHYPADAIRPANRVAVHVLDEAASLMAELPETQHLAVLVPRGAHPVDVAVISRAVQGLRGVRQRRLEAHEVRDAGTFWPTPPDGRLRLWRTVPAAVPDSRSPRKHDWTLAHAVRLSTAMVFRDQLPAADGSATGTGARYVALAEAAERVGVDVVAGDFLHTSNVTPYVHKPPERGVVRPYSASLSLGALTSRALVAIGQTRHLGGGLLIPDGSLPAAAPEVGA